MDPIEFFSQPNTPRQKQYEALRAFYVDKIPAKKVAAKFGYTLSTFYSLTKEFRVTLIQEQPEAHYFIHPQLGVKPKFEGTQTVTSQKVLFGSGKGFQSISFLHPLKIVK